jgi:hypothetical protein
MTDEKRAFVQEVIGQMKSSDRDLSAPGITGGEMIEVLNHPKAVDTIFEMVTMEADSAQQGAPAPDFCLKPLNDYAGGTPVRLSDHFGKRPVALVFGSYT